MQADKSYLSNVGKVLYFDYYYLFWIVQTNTTFHLSHQNKTAWISNTWIQLQVVKGHGQEKLTFYSM